MFFRWMKFDEKHTTLGSLFEKSMAHFEKFYSSEARHLPQATETLHKELQKKRIQPQQLTRLAQFLRAKGASPTHEKFANGVLRLKANKIATVVTGISLVSTNIKDMMLEEDSSSRTVSQTLVSAASTVLSMNAEILRKVSLSLCCALSHTDAE